MQRNLDSVRLHPDDLADLLRSKVGAVAKRHELSVSIVELGERRGQIDAPHGIRFELRRVGRIDDLSGWHTLHRRVGDTPPRDAYQPRDSVALRRVEAIAVTKRPL